MTNAFKMQALPSHVFGPGSNYESQFKVGSEGKKSYKGTYSLEGSKLKVKYDPALERQDGEWEVAREGEVLLVGKKTGAMVYKRSEEPK
jgi:hypothetical protein